MDTPAVVYGVDWSGALDAGARVWVARGEPSAGGLRIAWVRPGADLPGSGVERDRCLPALGAFIASQDGAVFGLDFPFGLPRSLVEAATWEAFVLSFAARYPTSEAFRSRCRKAARGREARRDTDREAGTPFSPYNLRLYRQTFFGIRDLLAPLVRGHAASVVPMQPPLPGRPWLVEICPASTLKREGLYGVRYKAQSGGDRVAAAGRARVLRGIERALFVSFASPGVRRSILDDPRGDALDSVVAACAVSRSLRDGTLLDGPSDGPSRLEGRVFT